MSLLSQDSILPKHKAKKYKAFINYKDKCDSYHENFVSIACSAFSCILDENELQSLNCENRVHLDYEFYIYLKSFWNYK